jgi:hypothetical protein
MSKLSSQPPRWLAIALAGPILEGAILGLRAGPRAMLVFGLGLPAIVAAVTLLTTPTLYVGGAVVGDRRSLGEVAAAAGRALHALGLALLGLAPLSLLLAATLPAPAVVPAQGVALLLVGLMIALHRLSSELGVQVATGPRRRAGQLLFTGYTAVTFIIGARLFHDLALFSERFGS